MATTDWQKAHMQRLRDAAQVYLDMGWSFFPIGMDKKPLIKWARFQHAAPTPDEVDDWFDNGVELQDGSRVLQFNLGLATGTLSGVVVVDCDNPEALAKAQELGLTSPFRANTRRGAHFYWAHPRNGETFGNKAGGNPNRDLEWPCFSGLDFRGDGGFVVLPPSLMLREDGDFTYHWDNGVPSLEDLDPAIDGYCWRRRYFARDAEQVSEAEIQKMLSAGQLPFSLAGVRPQQEQRPSIVEELAGAKVLEGGRNHALTRFVGELVADGVHGDALAQAVDTFMAEHFVEMLPQREVDTTIRSVLERDRRQHPERYDEDGNPRQTPPPAPPPPSAPATAGRFQFILPDDIDAIRAAVGRQPYLMFPCLPRPSIMMVYGFSGHGKSLFVQHLTYALASGQDFGPYEFRREYDAAGNLVRRRVLYIDLENGLTTIADRLEALVLSFTKRVSRDDYMTWSPARGEDLNLNTPEGIGALKEMLIQSNPDVVVLDTVRTAFTGFAENKAEEWSPVNRLAMAIRNAGISVILLHHANKPKDGEPGKEAGSTNQLTNIETQLRVTQIFDEDDAGKEAAAENYGLVDGKGWSRIRSLIGERQFELQNTHGKPFQLRLRTGMRVSYGKVRGRTDSHRLAYFGFCEDQDGAPHWVGSLSLRAAVLRHHFSTGDTASAIASNWGISVTDVRRWIAEATA